MTAESLPRPQGTPKQTSGDVPSGALSSVIWPTSTRLHVVSAFSAQQDHSSLLEFNLPKPCLENVSRQTARVKRVLNSFISFYSMAFYSMTICFSMILFQLFSLMNRSPEYLYKSLFTSEFSNGGKILAMIEYFLKRIISNMFSLQNIKRVKY